MGEMVNCATVFKHKFVFRNANMFLLSILNKKTFCLISESSWAKKEDGYKQKGKQSVSPQLKLSAVNKGLQSAVGQPQTVLFISSLINSSPLFFLVLTQTHFFLWKWTISLRHHKARCSAEWGRNISSGKERMEEKLWLWLWEQTHLCSLWPQLSYDKH